MSTRATYQIDNKYFYIHYDGYPSGAATYFYATLTFDNKRGGLAEQFLRANDLAEFTGSHEIHGDSEYRYTLEGSGYLKAEERIDFSDQWKAFYLGDVAEFINKYSEEVSNNTLPKIVKSSQYGYMSLDQLTDKLYSLLNRGRELRLKGHTGNASSSYGEAWKVYLDIFAQSGVRLEVLEKEIRETAIYFTEAYNWTMDDAVNRWADQFYPLPKEAA